MAKKNRTHAVTPPKQEGKRGTIHCGTITLEDQLKSERAARRAAQIESGTFCRGGVHGGGKHERNKRDRSEWKRKMRKGYDD